MSAETNTRTDASTPRLADIVHYVSYGTPDREYPSTCRTAIVTAVNRHQASTQDSGGHINDLDLCVLNPEGQFFNRHVQHDAGDGQPADPNCPNGHGAGTPFRYCGCGWIEPSLKGGTWHNRDVCPAGA